jgi:hypothetical protein
MIPGPLSKVQTDPVVVDAAGVLGLDRQEEAEPAAKGMTTSRRYATATAAST